MATQVLKLGLPGAESTLITESRINEGGQDTFNYIEGLSAGGSLKVDVVATKGSYNISWGVMSDDDFNDLYNIYLLQFSTTPAYLSYIFTNQSGVETTKTVFMQPPSRGPLVQKDVFYNNAVTISMQEV